MKRDQRNDRTRKQQRLVLQRDTIRSLHDEAMHQARGGAGGYADSGLIAFMDY